MMISKKRKPIITLAPGVSLHQFLSHLEKSLFPSHAIIWEQIFKESWECENWEILQKHCDRFCLEILEAETKEQLIKENLMPVRQEGLVSQNEQKS
jgi:hypothetical protein